MNARLALFLDDFRFGPYENTSSSRGVSLVYSGGAVNGCLCREVRTLDEIHKVAYRAVGIVEKIYGTVDYLAEVVRRNIGRHTYGNTY